MLAFACGPPTTPATFAPAGEPELREEGAGGNAARKARHRLRPLPRGSSRSGEARFRAPAGAGFGLVDAKPAFAGAALAAALVLAVIPSVARDLFCQQNRSLATLGMTAKSSRLKPLPQNENPVSPNRRRPVGRRRSFPHTAAGQRRDWIGGSAPASLLISSFHLDEEMKTFGEGKLRPPAACVKGR